MTPTVALDNKKNKEAIKYCSNLVDKKYWMIFFISTFFLLLQKIPHVIISELFKIEHIPYNLFLFLYFSVFFIFFLISSFNFVATVIVYNKLKMMPDKVQTEILNEMEIPAS